MNKSAIISARIQPKLKKEAEAVFRKVGLNTGQAISLFYASVKNYGGIPFDIRVPNSVTKRAIADARNRKTGRRFATVESLLDDIKN